jgi:hypothetical protein
MANEIQLKQTVVNREELNNAIDTSFNYFAKPVPEVDTDTVDELFRLYSKLYLEIPATGENSHEYLIKESSKVYQPEGITNVDIDPLLAEVADLRQRLLEANEQIQELISNQ